MLLAADPADPATVAWWLDPGVVAAYVVLLGTLGTIAYNGVRSRRDRQRNLFANAYAAVVDYWEYPYVVRRRRHDDPAGERVRISEQLRQVQRDIAFHQAWIRADDRRVAATYDEFVRVTRQVMGGQIRTAWQDPPAEADGDMNIDDVDRDGLDDASDRYLQAVRDRFSLWPRWAITLARWFRRLVR